MMVTDLIRLGLAIGLPWLVGILLVRLFWRDRSPGYWPIVIGMGFPLGLVGIVVGYVLLGHWGPGLSFHWAIGIQLLLCALLASGLLLRPEPAALPSTAQETNLGWSELHLCVKVLLFMLLGLMLLRWVGMLVEVSIRPLFPWDAWQAYGLEAKAWFYHERFGIFADGREWFQADGPVFASSGMRHPPGVGLIQLWMSQTLGRWDDALINLPWAVLPGAMAFAMFGMLRQAGLTIAPAMVVAWLGLTVPMANAHVVLAGYGDIWVGAYLCLASGSVYFLARSRDYALLVSLVVSTVGFLALKESGLLWLLPLVAGVLVALVSWRWLLAMASGLIALAFSLVLFMEGSITIPTLGQFGIEGRRLVYPSHDPVWGVLAKHLFVYGNWNLLWLLALPPVFCMLYGDMRSDRALRALVIIVFTGLLMLTVVFGFSDISRNVLDGTRVNRLLLHIAPSLILLCGLCLAKLQGRLSLPSPGEGR
jgi:hypothetical protein